MMNADRKQTAAGDQPGDLPFIDTENLKLADLIDTPTLQKLMEDFYELTGVPMSIIDIEGKVLVGVGWQEICTRFHRTHPETCKFCLESDLFLTQDIQEGDIRLYKCKNHMWDAACPLVIDGRRMGHLFTGQFFFDDEIPDEPLFRIQAEQYGFDVNRYLAALRKVPRLSRDKVRRAMGFLHGLAKMISQESCSRLKLARLCQQKNQSERSLRESESRFRGMFEHSPEAILLSHPDGSIFSANPAACRMLGYTEKEICAAGRQGILDSADPRLQAALRERQANKIIRGVELTAVHKTGRKFLAEVDSVIISAPNTESIVLLRDITDRKQTEEALRQSEERLRSLAENVPCVLMRFDRQLRIVYLSKQSERYTPNPVVQMIGQTNRQMGMPEHLCDRWDAAIERVFRTGTQEEMEFDLDGPSGPRTFSLKFAPEFGPRHEVQHVLGVSMDITERKQAEKALRQFNESLEQRVAERTEEVRQQADQLRALAAKLSLTEQRERKRLSKILHDHIQQLIVAARMQLNWIQEADEIQRQAALQSADAILDEALQTSRSLAVDLSPPVLNEVGLAGGLDWLSARMREKYLFTVDLAVDENAEPAAEEIRFLLFECARELLFNAVKHAGIKAASVSLTRSDDNRIQLVVSDQGGGFDPDLFNNRRPEEETFGLFSIRERLTYMGGHLQIESAPGRGSCFTLTILAESILQASSAPSKPADGKPSPVDYPKSCRVLVCDDHKVIREGVARLLQSEPGIEVVGLAAEGLQAIEMAGQMLPDVILMDINLGQMSGIEATSKILARTPQTRIIGLSMHEDKAVADAMHKAGAVAFLSKDGPSERLITAVKTAGRPKTV